MSGLFGRIVEVSGGVVRWRALPYLVLLLVTLFCHGFLLTNDGLIWDSWFVHGWLKTKSWTPMAEFFGSVGMPLYAVLYWPFAFAPDIVGAFMWATFLALLAGGILTYRLALALDLLGKGEALTVAALSLSMPLFLAAQDFIMFFFIFTHTVFLAAALLVAQGLKASGWKHVVLRGCGWATFALSFSNAGLLVYYGVVCLLFFLHFRARTRLSSVPAALQFAWRYPDLLLLPPVAWGLRHWLMPQYGWYEHYNSIATHFPNAGESLLTFAEHVIPFHLVRTLRWPIDHPLATGFLLVGALAWWRWAPRVLVSRRTQYSGWVLPAFGLGSLLLAVLPYAVAGKRFPHTPLGEDSHHLLLTGFPAALLVFSALRPLIWWRGVDASRWLVPVAGGTIFVLGSQITAEYVKERSEWVFARSLLHNAARNETVRESSVIYIRDRFSLSEQHAYAIYAFAGVFGEVRHFVSHHVPVNSTHFTPPEILSTLLRTTVVPGEFRRIDPSGQQIWLQAERRNEEQSPWGIVGTYLGLRYSGDRPALERYLAGLTTVRTHVLRRRTRLKVAEHHRSEAAQVPPGLPGAVPFVNGAGVRMRLLPWSLWAGQYEVTQKEYEKVMGYNPSLFRDPERPVECVSWDEAADFCRRLTATEGAAGRLPKGYVYRLPTSEEFDALYAKGSEASAVIATSEGQWWTEPVGSRGANVLGLCDVAGNVWEWCLDWGSEDQRTRVSKGGAWTSTPGTMESRPPGWNERDPYERAATERLYGPIRRDYPDQAFWNRGFRVVLARAISEPVLPSK